MGGLKGAQGTLNLNCMPNLTDLSVVCQLLKSDIAAEACFRTKRMVKFCDKCALEIDICILCYTP